MSSPSLPLKSARMPLIKKIFCLQKLSPDEHQKRVCWLHSFLMGNGLDKPTVATFWEFHHEFNSKHWLNYEDEFQRFVKTKEWLVVETDRYAYFTNGLRIGEWVSRKETAASN